MASRVIRGEFNASRSMASRSMFAELLFAKLILEADDFGRMDGRLQLVRSRTFPMRDEVTVEDIDEWLTELATGEDAPIRRYQVGGDEFICFVNWEKHRGKSRRAEKSRLPDPPTPPAVKNPTVSNPTEGFPGDPGDPGDPLGSGSGVGGGGGGVADAPDPPPTAEDPKPVDPYRLPPDSPKLTDLQVQKLIDIKPNGMVHSPQDVACWYAQKRPAMVAAGKTNLWSAARNWWQRLRPGEVGEAREWVRDVNSRAAGARVKAEIAARPKQMEFTPEQIEETKRALTR